MGEFIEAHQSRGGKPLFGGPATTATVPDRQSIVAEILPFLRGVVSSNRRVIAHVDSSEDALTFANSKWAEDLCRMGTSCPDHFLRTRISPMFIAWNPAKEDVETAWQADQPSESRPIARTMRSTTRRAPMPRRRSCAIRTRRWSWSPAWDCLDSARTSAKRASPPSSL